MKFGFVRNYPTSLFFGKMVFDMTTRKSYMNITAGELNNVVYSYIKRRRLVEIYYRHETTFFSVHGIVANKSKIYILTQWYIKLLDIS